MYTYKVGEHPGSSMSWPLVLSVQMSANLTEVDPKY